MKEQAWISSLETMPQILVFWGQEKIIILIESRELRIWSVLFYKN